MSKLKYRLKYSDIITFALLIVGILCIIGGVMRQENRIVMEKAINICLECIGIG